MRRGIRSGELRTKYTIQRALKSKNATTGQKTVDSWEDVKSFYGKELKGGSKETFEARQQVAVTEARIFCRWGFVFKAITADMTTITADNTTITADNLNGVIKVVDETMRLVRRGEILYIKGIEGAGAEEGYAIIKAERRG